MNGAARLRFRAFPAAAAVLLLALGCGEERESKRDPARLAWDTPPRVFTPPGLPRDRVILGTIRNVSSRRVELGAGDLRLVAPDGRRLDADLGFVGSYVKPDESQNRDRDLDEVSPAEKRRLGRTVELDPGQTAPLSLAWRRRPGDPRRASIDYGGGRLPLTVSR